MDYAEHNRTGISFRILILQVEFLAKLHNYVARG